MPAAQDSKADTILDEGIPLDNSSCHSVGGRSANAYVFREMSRLVIVPKHGYGGWLFIDIADIGGDIAPGH